MDDVQRLTFFLLIIAGIIIIQKYNTFFNPEHTLMAINHAISVFAQSVMQNGAPPTRKPSPFFLRAREKIQRLPVYMGNRQKNIQHKGKSNNC